MRLAAHAMPATKVKPDRTQKNLRLNDIDTLLDNTTGASSANFTFGFDCFSTQKGV
jgi:hypothetical protein